MNDWQTWLGLFIIGTIGHCLFRRSGDIGRMIFNNKGEGETVVTPTEPPVKFTAEQQKSIDHVIQERLARERQKFTDYDDLKKFKTEFEKSQDQKAQEELVKQKKYEEAETGYKKQIGEVQSLVTTKDAEIRNLKINHVLSNEINKLNGYVEESTALLFKDADLDKSGNIVIKGKDANGLDVVLPVAEGVKRFLETRPHLVKSTHQRGGGSGSGDGQAAGSDGVGKGQDHNTLNADLKRAIDVGDKKKANEIKTKLSALGFVRR